MILSPLKTGETSSCFYCGQTAYGLPKENAGHCKKYFRNTFIYSSAYFKHCYPVSVQTCKNDLIPQLRVSVRHLRNRLNTTSPCSCCISRCKSIFSSLADTYCIILLRPDPLKHNQKILPASHNAKQPIPYARLFRIFYTHQVSRDTAHHYSQIPPHLLTKMNSTCTLILI